MPLIRRIRPLIAAYPPLLWLLGAIALLNWFGFSFVWPVISVYIHDELGHPLAVAGVALLLHSGGGALGSLVGGWWFDRSGGRWVLLTGFTGSAILVAMIGTVTNWPLLLAAMCAYGFTTFMSFPAMTALAVRAWPEGGRRTFTFVYVVANLGGAAGTAVGGLLASVSFTLAFLSAGVVALAAAILVYVGVRDTLPPVKPNTAENPTHAPTGRPTAWLPIGGLFLGFLTCWAVYVQWQGPLPVHMRALGIGLPRFSLLWSLNGLFIVLGQPLVTLGLRRLPSLWTQLVLGVCLYGASFGLMTMATIYPALIAGILCLSLGEMLIHPGVPAAADQLGPPERRGVLQGFIVGAGNVGRMIGPLAGGIVFDRWGFGAVPLVCIAALAIPLAAFVLYGFARKPQPAPFAAQA